MIDDLKALLPEDQLDIEKSGQLVALGYPAVAPMMQDILSWIVTPNDFVAWDFIGFVRGLEVEAVPHIAEFLAGDFTDGKYGVLSLVVSALSHASVALLVPTLERLALEPTDEDRGGSIDVLAVGELATRGLGNPALLRTATGRILAAVAVDDPFVEGLLTAVVSRWPRAWLRDVEPPLQRLCAHPEKAVAELVREQLDRLASDAPDPTRDELLALMPAEKLDTASSSRLVALGFPAVLPVVPEILRRLDPNDTVTCDFAPFVRRVADRIVPEMRALLREGLTYEKYDFFNAATYDPKAKALAHVHPEMKALAFHPSPHDRAEGLDALALLALDQQADIWDSPPVRPALRRLVEEGTSDALGDVLDALGHWPVEELRPLVPALRRLLEHANRYVAKDARAVLSLMEVP